jgi:hypothetical protein
MFKRHVSVLAGALVLVVALLTVGAGVVSAAPAPYSNGFEIDITDWDAFGGGLNATRVASGTNGITSASGSFHAENSAAGSASRWGGYNYGAGHAVPTVFHDYSTSVDLYLNVGGGWANDTRFDFSSAINNNLGTHRRDFIFNAGFYNDTDGSPGSGTSRFVISASNNSQPGSAFAKNPGRDPIAISTSGWYTFVHHFRDNAGVLAVDLSILDSSSVLVHSWTLSDATDLIAGIGGNRYGWFDYNQFSTLAFDNAIRFEPAVVVPCTLTCYADAVGGNDANGGDTPATAKKTIQAAINQVDPGGTVIVAAGTYSEQVVVDKTVTLSGPNAGVSPGPSGVRANPEAIITTLVGATNGTPSDGNTIVIAADDVTVDGFTIQNTSTDVNDVAVLVGGKFVGDLADPSNGNTIENNIITGGRSNIYMWQSSHNLVQANRSSGAAESMISIRDNSTQGSRDAKNNTIEGNWIDKAGVASDGHGIAIGLTGGAAQDFSGTLIKDNVISNSGAGTGLVRGIDANGANGTPGSPVKIYGNTLTDFSENGIRIENANDYDIGGTSAGTGNAVTGNRGAIGAFRRGITTAGSSTNLSIQYNTVSGNSSTSGNDAEIVVTTAGNTVLHNTLFVAASSAVQVGGLGLRLDSPSNVFGENTFQGDGTRMLQASGAPGPGLTEVNVTASTFRTSGGTLLMPTSNVDLVAIEDRVRHHMDVPGNLVLLTFKSNTTVATALNNTATPEAIHRGVDSASSGWTVVVGPGTYDEADTLININKSLTITGPNALVSPNTGVRAPEAVITSSPAVAVFAISAGTSVVTFEGLEFDTPSAPMRDDYGDTITLRKNIFTATGGANDGMYFEDPVLTLDDNRFTGIATPNADTLQVGGHYPSSSHAISITDNVWDTITESGGLNLSNVTGTITGNSFKNVEYYGILVANASGNLDINHNTFDGITNPAPGISATWGAGVRFYAAVASTGPVTVTKNTFTNSYLGVSVNAVSALAGAGIVVTRNSIAGNDDGILNAGTGTLNALCNWYGAASGPGGAGPGAGDTVSTLVTFAPWLVTANLDGDCPGLSIVKTANPGPYAPYQPVTYTYKVTNTGDSTLTGIVVTDDNGTPDFAGDDFTVDTIPTLAASNMATLTATVIPVVSTMGVVNGNPVPAGSIIVVVPQANGDIKATYLQAFGINDNTYGTGSIGWPAGKPHTFANLTGSDKLEFRFFDKAGHVVLDFYQDYISASGSFPSGYGSLCASGGDGFMVSGLVTNIRSCTTSLADNFNVLGNVQTVNSPAPTGVDGQGNPTRANWNYINSYTVVIKGTVFGTGTAAFGSVAVPDQHNSPNKLGGPNGMATTPKDSTVTNTATATSGSVTATTTATVQIVVPPQPPVAVNDSYKVKKNKTLTVATPGVLANDTDPNGDPLTATLALTTPHGTLTLNSNGSFTYKPALNFTGTDTFTYKAKDATLFSNVATVTIKVEK